MSGVYVKMARLMVLKSNNENAICRACPQVIYNDTLIEFSVTILHGFDFQI